MRTVKLSSNQAISIFSETLLKGDSIQFTVKGTSMEPTFHHNKTIVTVEPYAESLQKHDIVLVKEQNHLLLHRIIRLSPIIIRGDALYENEYIEAHQILGVVSHYEYNDKKHKVHSFYQHNHYRIIRMIRLILQRLKHLVKRT